MPSAHPFSVRERHLLTCSVRARHLLIRSLTMSAVGSSHSALIQYVRWLLSLPGSHSQCSVNAKNIIDRILERKEASNLNVLSIQNRLFPLPPRFHLPKGIASVLPSDRQSTRHHLNYVAHSPLTAVPSIATPATCTPSHLASSQLFTQNYPINLPTTLHSQYPLHYV